MAREFGYTDMCDVGFLQSTIGVLLVEAGVDDAALLVIEALRPAGGRARPSSIRAVHMKLQWDVPFM
jgi:hypothetical protein